MSVSAWGIMAGMTETSSLARVQRAVRAACAVAEAQRLAFDDAVVLNDRSNVLVHLRPRPVVARVSTTTATVRPGDAWLAREVAIAGHLTAAGAPVVSPSREIAPGPHEHDGLVLSFWELVETRPEPADPCAAGRALRQCHEALADFTRDLPILGALAETERLLPALVAAGALSAADGELLRGVADRVRRAVECFALPMQPVRGDAHLGNVLNTTRGPLWIDWEDTFTGPVAWDLACLVAFSRVTGTDIERSAAALSAYDAAVDDHVLDVFVEARALYVTVWSVVISSQFPGNRDRVDARLRWFRARGDSGRGAPR